MQKIQNNSQFSLQNSPHLKQSQPINFKNVGSQVALQQQFYLTNANASATRSNQKQNSQVVQFINGGAAASNISSQNSQYQYQPFPHGIQKQHHKPQSQQLFQKGAQQINQQVSYNTPQFQKKLQHPSQIMSIQEHSFRNQKFNDDEPITMSDQNIQNPYVLNDEDIDLTFRPQFQNIQLSSVSDVELPVLVTMKVKEMKQDTKSNVDLICVIDKSGSMEGQKLKNAKIALKKLLHFLTDDDRICIIEFDDGVERLTRLKRGTLLNKQKISKKIDSIQSSGLTDIGQAMECAFKQLKERKYQNKVTSIFLLSDGMDNSGLENTRQLSRQIDQSFTIQTFGFGEDHDAEMLRDIARIKDGNFYFVSQLSLLDEFFADALGVLQSIVAENARIYLKYFEQSPLKNCKIIRTYGDAWRANPNDDSRYLKIRQLVGGVSKDFLFLFKIPQATQQIDINQRKSTLLKGAFTVKSPQKEIIKNFFLNITLFNEGEQIPQKSEDEYVTVNYYRVKAAKIIDKARVLCQSGQNLQAQKMINVFLESINKNLISKHILLQNIYKDLKETYEACDPENFQSYGSSQMYQYNHCHMNQQSLPATFQKGKQVSATVSKSQNVYANTRQTLLQTNVASAK